MTGRVQPPPASQVLTDLQAERCEHGDVLTVPPRCPLCRAAEPQPDPPDEPTTTQPQPTAVTDDDDQDPRHTPWWDR